MAVGPAKKMKNGTDRPHTKYDTLDKRKSEGSGLRSHWSQNVGTRTLTNRRRSLLVRLRYGKKPSQTFSCDELEDVGKSYLRADYGIDCDSDRHKAFKLYAGFMILVRTRTCQRGKDSRTPLCLALSVSNKPCPVATGGGGGGTVLCLGQHGTIRPM